MPEQFDTSPNISAPANLIPNDIKRQSQIALAAYRAGVCTCASFGLGKTKSLAFDTHQLNDVGQLSSNAKLLEGVTFFLEEAERQGVIDRTYVMIASDFGRRYAYTGNEGKGHWRVGSMTLMGPGIRGGRVLGATTDYLDPVPVHPTTFAPTGDVSGIILRPGHIHIQLRRALGIEDDAITRRFALKEEDLDLFS